MKKFLTILGLISVLSMGSAAFAAPPQSPGHHHPQVIHAGHSYHRPPHLGDYGHVPPPPPPRYHRHYGGSAVIGGALVRRSCWNNYFYDSRMSFCDDYVYRPNFGGGIYIRF